MTTYASYRWSELLPTDEPSRELVAAVTGADVRFTANLVGSEHGKEWQTSSWVELAYRKCDEEIAVRIAEINARFDAYRPSPLRVRGKSYGKDRLSIVVSDGGQRAQRKLLHVNTGSMSAEEIGATVKAGIGETIELAYNTDMARWCAKAHGDTLLAKGAFDLSAGFNLLVWIQQEKLAAHE